MILDKSRTRAGMLPFDSHMTGIKIGAIKF